ncbi:ABC transporter permease subunit [Dactylosporangium sp. McL0621]|uniref:ABC transporter permease subunit n=1 Tax=Dactylosporangium sp. McL0621 TaxID=3415678 RepID=UPI003CE77154
MSRPRALWPTWRLHRTALLTSAAVLLALVLLLVLTGAPIRQSYHRLGIDACRSGCTALQLNVFAEQAQRWGLWTQFLALLPGLLGMFVGAPLLAREYEAGTFRFAWTQGITPRRLLLTKVALLGGALVAVTLAFSAFFHWWYTPITVVKDRLAPWPYQADGVYLAAATLFCFAFGLLAGAVLRRTVVAMFVTGAAWVAVFLGDWYLLRPHFAAPLLAEGTGTGLGHGGRSWVVDSWVVDASGHRLSDAEWNAVVALHAGDLTWTQADYTTWMRYEPGSRFWAFQAIDASWLVAAAVLFLLATLWWLRRRPI